MSEYTNENDGMDAVGYLKTLFLQGDTLDILLIHEKTKAVHDSFATLEDAAKPETIESIAKAQQDGWNVYCTMNALQPGAQHRKKQDVQAIRSVWIDVDENGQTVANTVLEDVDAGIVPDPSLILQSSPGKCYIIWLVQGFTVEQAEEMNCALQQRYHADPAATDAARVLRLPGTQNLKYADKPVVKIVYQTNHERYALNDFHLPAVEPEDSSVESSSDSVPDEGFSRLFEKVGWKPLIDRMNKMSDTRFHGLELQPGKLVCCPMPAHKPRSTDIAYRPVFGPIKETPELLHCLGGCKWSGDLVKTIREFDSGPDGGYRHYLDMYAVAEQICLEEGLKFEEFFPKAVQPAIQPAGGMSVEADPIQEIPPFDPAWMTGVYRKYVELAIGGTTMQPQFSFLACKTIIYALAAWRFIKFENLETAPRLFSLLVGESGSGKGLAYRRALQILQAGLPGDIKIFNSIDSGAGLRDAFFEENGLPINKPILLWIDELMSFGNKASSNRNPAVLDDTFELKDSTSVSRVLTKGKGRGSEVSNDHAQLSLIGCAQNADVIARAFQGRNEVGCYDRLTPEYGEPVEGRDLPEINLQEARELVLEILRLLEKAQASGISSSPEADTELDSFWKAQPDSVRKKVRFRNGIRAEASMIALGDGRSIVRPEDVRIAEKIFVRQLAVRAAFFGMEISDRVSYYLAKIKQRTDWMRKQLSAGVSAELVALSKRDYERLTNASKLNEEHLFARAWQTHCLVHLKPVTIIRTNGHRYEKYVPKEEDEQAA